MPTYEVLHAIRRKADEEPQTEGMVSMSEEEAQVFLERNAVRLVPGQDSEEYPEAEGDGEPGDDAPVEPRESEASVQSVNATDGAREKAEELNVDLTHVSGTGDGGRIQAYDVQRHAKEAGGSDPQ